MLLVAPERLSCTGTFSDDEYNRFAPVLISHKAQKTAQREFLPDDELFIWQLVRHFFLVIRSLLRGVCSLELVLYSSVKSR